MTARVNGSCIGCGLCANTCPDIFTMTEDNVAVARDEIPPEYWEFVQEAAESCPVLAIEVKE